MGGLEQLLASNYKDGKCSRGAGAAFPKNEALPRSVDKVVPNPKRLP